MLRLLVLALLWAPAASDVEEWIRRLHEERDDTPIEVIQSLVEDESRDAFDGLSEGYDRLDSIYARRMVLELLPAYDGVIDVEQAALQKLMDVATQAPEPELRETAVASIARFERLGKGFLRIIVDSLAVASVREQALREHIAKASEDDYEWYQELFERTPELVAEQVEKAQKEARQKRLEEPELPPRFHAGIRRLAFGQILSSMDSSDLAELAKDDFDSEVRRMSLMALGESGGRDALKAAKDRFKRVDERPKVRLKAAEVLAALEGEDIIKSFLDMAGKSTTPDQVRKRMAELAASLIDDSEKARKALVKRLGKGKPAEQRFVFLATRRIEEEKVDKALIKALDEDKERGLQLLALQLMAERGRPESEEPIREILTDEDTPRVLRDAAFYGLAELLRGTPEWLQELGTFAQTEDRDVRNAALSQLEVGEIDVLLSALQHDDWSTRLTVVERLVELRLKEGVKPLIDRLDVETGRLQFEMAEALFELTGENFGVRQSAWNGWWADKGANADLPSGAEMEKLKGQFEERRLKQRTTADPLRKLREESPEFFGVRLVSQRVVFVLDISGSMAWEVGGEESSRGEPIRIDIAKAELLKTLEGLRPEALFNLIAFSSGISAWSEGGVFASSEKTRADALEFVNRIGVGGGTNIYSALRAAFADPEADTIVLLSDGEPSMGRITDSSLLRDEVARWNENRGIVIHTIAVGNQLDLLEWLALDTGGRHVRYE